MAKLLTEKSELVKRLAINMGFDGCGISVAQKLEPESYALEQFLNKNHHGQMGWLANNFEKRTNPTLLVDGAKSVISIVLHYTPHQNYPNRPLIARYALTNDYHFVFKRMLKTLFGLIREQLGQIEGRVFVDSAPVMDKAWAKRAGLGWIGRNTNLINPKAGSYFLIGEIISDLELAPDNPIKDYCGTCTKCVDACPTDALNLQGHIDARKCISYQTIELKGEENKTLNTHNWVFGCDICQQVCPWNRFATQANLALQPNVTPPTVEDWNEMTESEFKTLFKHTPLMRAGFTNMQVNLKKAIKK